jgi:hypothetical protein
VVEFLVKVDLEVAGAFSIFIGAMGQVLRITFNDIDYSFQILNSRPVNRETAEIQILLNGATQTLVYSNGSWLPKAGNDMVASNLALAIGKAIALRYRI